MSPGGDDVVELGAWVEEEIVPPLLERDVQGVVVGVYSEIGHIVWVIKKTVQKLCIFMGQIVWVKRNYFIENVQQYKI